MLAGVAIALLALTDLGGATPSGRIVAVRVVRYNVFDTGEKATSSWPYRTANALHIVTHDRFIRSLLLFREGDTLDLRLLEESERLLRATGFLEPVHITAHPAEGGVEVTVETHDKWTLEASIIYGLQGSRKNSGFTVKDDNFLGWGKTVELEYRDRSERNTTMLFYKDPLFLGSRWQLSVSHTEASDGSEDMLRLEYPFFSLDTPRAGGASWRRDEQVDHLWAGGHKVVSGDARRHEARVWGGLRLPWSDGAVDRVTAGFFQDRAEFSNWHWRDDSPYPTPADRNLAGILLGWEHQTDSWRVVQGFRAWRQQEDVPLGPNWDVQLGVSLPALGGDANRLRLDASVLKAWLTDRHYTWTTAGLSGRLDRGNPTGVVLHLEAGAARTGRVGWRARIAADLGHDLDGDQQLALGADTGLRGWDPDWFDGTSRAVANLEWRHQLTDEVLHLGVIGLALFTDAGSTWKPRAGPDTNGVRADVGAGLLVEITRASVLRIVRVEVAFPDDGSGPIFIASSSSVF